MASMSMTAELPKKRPLLATILSNENALPAHQLDEALRVWNHHRKAGVPMAFGQVVLKLKLMSPKELGPFVQLQRRLAGVPGGRKPLGLLAVEAGAVKPLALIDALEAQAESGKRLGELLIQRGLLRKNQVDALLYFQRQAA
jgi:hypothetical protein